MRSYLVRSLVIVMLAASGCGDNRPGTDARDSAGDKMGDGSGSNDRADLGGSAGTGGSAGSSGGTTGGGGTGGGIAGTGGGIAGTGGGVDGSAGTGGTGGGIAGTGGGVDGGTDVPAPTCSDGIKNSDETGIDCGGHCGKCTPGNPCLVNADCQFACRADKTCAACNVATDCPGTESECEHRTCTAGVCGSTRETAGTVLMVQATGDCKRRQCAADATVNNANDDTDVPDDRNACTNDICTTGAPSHTMMPSGSNCGGANHCNATGQCIGCTVATDCPGSDTPCRTRTCAAGGVCQFSFATAGMKLVDPMPKDCKGMQCDGAGNEQVFNDNADLPVDSNVCTTDECSSGTPSNRPVASGMSCGGSLVCDGASKCVECLSASTCPGTDADCHTRSCVAGTCGVSNMAAGTLAAPQTQRDCKKNVCDGQGAIASANDDLDLPVDGNPCTQDVCTAGTPSNPSVTAGNSCGTNTICDGQGACVTCLTPTSCPGSDTECHHRTCINGACGMALTPAGTPLISQDPGDCKRKQCDGAGQGVVVNDDTDKPVDGNACTDDVCTAGAFSNPFLPSGTNCGTNLMCNGQGACVGCITAANCGTDTPCQTHTCSAAGVCGVNNAAAGTLLPAANQMAGDCKKVQCDGAGQSQTVNDDTDKMVDGNACTKDLCTAGIPSNPPEDSGTTCSQNNGTRCNGSGTAPACVQCNQTTDCPGTDNECHHRTCTAGVCGISNDPDGKLVSGQTTGDCQKKVCMGGNEVVANDDTDLPDDSKQCTTDLCTAGVASHMFLPADSTCSETGGTRCNGSGTCVQCLSAGQCGNNVDCRSFTCDAGQCVTHDVPNGMAIATQTPRDCKTKVCNGTGGVVDAADDNDLPVDGNQCTDDNCSNGVASNPSRAAHDPCNQSNGSFCNGSTLAPACVECVGALDCGANTTCKTFSCSVTGQCSSSNANDGTLVSDDPGDCHKTVCMTGLATNVVDNNDVNVDGNPCTDDLCMSGVPQNPNVAPGVMCGLNQMCNGAGACVGCIMDSDCPAAPNACQTPVCTGGTCGFANKAANTPVTVAPAGDCHAIVCDDAGNEISVVDNNDKPSNNGQQCVQSVCTNGEPSNPPFASGTACTENGHVECDGAGACVDCINANECPPGNGTECETATCTSGLCGIFRPDPGTPTTTQISNDCKTNVCDGSGHVTTSNDNLDLPVNNNECRDAVCSNGTPGTPPKLHGTSCTVGGRTCNGAGTCDTTFSVIRMAGVSSAGTAVGIEEYQLNGTLVGTTPMPTTASGSNRALVNSGSASSEGSLSLSADGRYLVLAGYNAAVGTPTVASAANIDRVVGRVDAASPAGIDTSTAISQSVAFSANNVRGATSFDGTSFWVSGAGSGAATDGGPPPNNGGLWWISLHGTTGGPTQINTVLTNTRWVHIFAGQLYGTSNTVPNANVFTVGTGLPTTSGAAVSSLPGMPIVSGPSPFSFVLFDRDSNGAFETMYVTDDGNGSNQGLQKWTFGLTAVCTSTPCWTRVATYNTSVASPVDFKGLAGYMAADGSSVTLMATTDEANSRLVRVVEVFTPTPSVTVTPLLNSGTTSVFRGVALSPHL